MRADVSMVAATTPVTVLTALSKAAVWETGSRKSVCDSGPLEIPDAVFPCPL